MRNIVLNIRTTCIEKGDVVVLLGCACAWCSIIGIRYLVHTTGMTIKAANMPAIQSQTETSARCGVCTCMYVLKN